MLRHMGVHDSSQLVSFLEDLMRRRRRLPSQLAADLGVSHASMSRWLHGLDVPSTKSCRKIADYSRASLRDILAFCGHVPKVKVPAASSDSWPEFREYASRKYPAELDDDLVTMIEGLIEMRRGATRRAHERPPS